MTRAVDVMQHPTGFKRDVWDAPPAILTDSFTMSTANAAVELGLSMYKFRHAIDSLGLTVYRRPNSRHLRFSRHEIEEVKAIIEQTPVQEIIGRMKANGDKGLLQIKKAKKGRRRP